MDKNIKKLISIQICTYNRAEFIKEAILSAVNQTYTNTEIIIMDDASTDNTEEIVKGINDPRIKYFRNSTNFGISKNRNIAIDKCRGEYVAILDSDDLWQDNTKLEKQFTYMERNRDIAVCGTDVIKINEEGKEIGNIMVEKNDSDIRKKILLRNQFVNSSVLIRTSAILEVGKYDESLKTGEDYDLFLRIGEKYSFANLKGFFTSYRVGSQNIMKNTRQGSLDHLRIIKRYKNIYPNFFFALIKSYLRILLSYI